jgi:hypothetical protein
MQELVVPKSMPNTFAINLKCVQLPRHSQRGLPCHSCAKWVNFATIARNLNETADCAE